MKRVIVVALAMACLFTFTLPAFAADDVMITARVQSVTQAITKNGVPYVRIIIEEDRTLNGVSYKAGVPAMFFGEMAEQGKLFKAGDTLKAIVSPREFNSRVSYTVNTVIK